MKKALSLMMVLGCLFIATGCDPEITGETNNGSTPISETTITVKLDTTSGSAIPAQFNADVSWKIKDADWKAGDVYIAQAYFAGTGDTSVEIGSPLAFESTQTGTAKYAFKIPDGGLPSTVKKPYSMTIVVKKADTQIWKSDAWTFTEGKISGVYTGTLNYYTDFDEVTGKPIDAEDYDYRVTLTQYGNIVVGTNIFWLKSATESIPQTCTVLMTASTENNNTKLTGTGTYTNKTGTTTSYSGEAYVFGDGRTISCDNFWFSNDATKKSYGDFNADLKGTASISGKVTIENTYNVPSEDILFANHSEYDCVVAVLYTVTEELVEDCAGRMTMGPIEGTYPNYSFTYTLSDLPAGSYYLYFGGTDPESSTHMPWSTGEAIGLEGLEPSLAIRWISKEEEQEVKDAVNAIVPITVKDGETLTGKNITARIRNTDLFAIPVEPEGPGAELN